MKKRVLVLCSIACLHSLSIAQIKEKYILCKSGRVMVVPDVPESSPYYYSIKQICTPNDKVDDEYIKRNDVFFKATSGMIFCAKCKNGGDVGCN